MGFKRTSEGRVFFKGAEDNFSDTSSAASSPPPPVARKGTDYRTIAQGPAPQATQFQILSLLKSLNDKLKDNQSERSKMRAELDNYRNLIAELEGKASRSEQITGRAERAEKLAEETARELAETRKFLLAIEDKSERADKGVHSLQKQVGLTRALGDEIIRRQAGYDDLIKRIDQTETRYDALTHKVDQTVAQQSKMLRQIEKVAEDRARFMRKIERIEETVIQTRDALSAKAMVLLTEQGSGALRADAAVTPAPAPSVVDQVLAAGTEKPALELRTVALRVAAVAALLSLAIFAGWLMSQVQKNMSGTHTEPAEMLSSHPSSELRPDDTSANVGDTADFESMPAPAPTTESLSEAQETPEIKQEEPEVAKAPIAGDDLGTLDVTDENKLARMLEDNPDGLAAELNKIEPGSASPKSVKTEPSASAEKNPSPSEKPVQAAEPQKIASVAEPEKEPVKTTEELEPPAKKEPVTSMKPDRALPESARQIEAQAFAGVPEAQHDLAAIYTAGQGGVKQNYERAAFWFRQAADQGIANARYNLGVLYHQGLGVKQDIKEAIRWYKAAAKLNHPEAQYNLGIAYIEGIGVPYDPTKAAASFESAAGQGITEAAYNLGLIYENGLLGAAKPAEALKWYKAAADKGSPEAKEALEQLAQTLKVKVEDVNRVADNAPPAETKTATADVGKPQPPEPITNRQALTAQIQEYLVRAGLFPGPADGINSLQTEDAIRAYQKANKLGIDGKVSNELLTHMLANNAPAAGGSGP